MREDSEAGIGSREIVVKEMVVHKSDFLDSIKEKRTQTKSEKEVVSTATQFSWAVGQVDDTWYSRNSCHHSFSFNNVS